jgi:hypothetical protein
LPVYAEQHNVLPEVTVVDTYVDFWEPTWYFPLFLTSSTVQTGMDSLLAEYAGTQQEAAQLTWISSVGVRASVCFSALSSGARNTTRYSDVTSRWLAAQEVFNTMNAQNIVWDWNYILNSLQFLLKGVKYDGFVVYYADGSKETWAVNPAYATSSIKLLDQPLPNSLEPKVPHQNTPTCGPA